MFLSKPLQILDRKYEIDFLDILFTYIGSTKLSTDLLVFTIGKEFRVYISDIYIGERLFLKLH